MLLLLQAILVWVVLDLVLSYDYCHYSEDGQAVQSGENQLPLSEPGA
jgi:hypothetical protein